MDEAVMLARALSWRHPGHRGSWEIGLVALPRLWWVCRAVSIPTRRSPPRQTLAIDRQFPVLAWCRAKPRCVQAACRTKPLMIMMGLHRVAEIRHFLCRLLRVVRHGASTVYYHAPMPSSCEPTAARRPANRPAHIPPDAALTLRSPFVPGRATRARREPAAPSAV